MHGLTGLPAWEKLFKRIVWEQIGEPENLSILDFGSGQGITAGHYAEKNSVTAIEPSDEMLKDRRTDNQYIQIKGDVRALADFSDGSFDFVICHNVLEYIEDKKEVLLELCRVLKPGGRLSLVKHNRFGRVMQMAVLLDDFDRANALLDGEDSVSSVFGKIGYYEDDLPLECGFKLIDSFGIRTFWDLQQNQEKHSLFEWQEKMAKLEMRVSQTDAFRQIAFFHHLMLEKTR